MVAKVEPAGGWARWMGERSRASRIRWLAMAGLVLVTVAIALEIFRVGRLISPWPAEAAAIVMLGLAGLAIGASHRAIVALEAGLEILSRALDASPEAQLIVAAEGRVHYANRAFREAFPGSLGSPLDRLRQALGPGADSEAQFNRLRGRVAHASTPARARARTPVPKKSPRRTKGGAARGVSSRPTRTRSSNTAPMPYGSPRALMKNVSPVLAQRASGMRVSTERNTAMAACW